MMRVGIPSETKPDEHRVAITPAGVRELTDRGHEVVIERGAGRGAAIADRDFAAQGARIAPDAETVWREANLLVKVKEPQASELGHLGSETVLFTYLHLAAAPNLTQALRESGATCIAYETIEDDLGRLPLLAPMSEIAGRVATQAGAAALERPLGGMGILLGGVAGVPPANVMIIGVGNVGLNAADVALGLGANVFILDISIDRLREAEVRFRGRVSTELSSSLTLEEKLPAMDLVVGGVLVHGARAPHVLTRRHLAMMKRGAVLVDVAIDQGGCFETSRPTTHREPVFEIDGIVHYCVANMPGAVPITSTYALTNATLPYLAKLADRGLTEATALDPGFRRGINIADGRVTHPAVAAAVDAVYVPPETLDLTTMAPALPRPAPGPGDATRRMGEPTAA